jgi:hypothetical protein
VAQQALDDMTEGELEKLVHEIGRRLDSDKGKPGDREAKLAAFKALERKILARQHDEYIKRAPSSVREAIRAEAGIASQSKAGEG